ncbi:hypothetical protein LTR09_012142 [Extremus antarcticus]|uniref:Uncharacterized protein n=1 Tax=Extremus antarcticus TaxID=702011 RepID=A0AAJ0DAH1_9PEZI|nr:hypothetical protein LTR09_012142 [Extremus antarcticus]
MSNTIQQPFPPVRRVVTAHNEHGKAIVARDSLIDGDKKAHGPWIAPLWSTESLPPDVNLGEDGGLAKLSISNQGTIVRIVDFPPHSFGALHRSITLDYVYVLEGPIILTLDDGSRTAIAKDEIVVQQATMHGWDNETDRWARILCVLIASKPPSIGGEKLEASIPFKI